MKKHELLELIRELIKEEIEKSETLLSTPKTLRVEKLIENKIKKLLTK
jgi:hypothetical protein